MTKTFTLRRDVDVTGISGTGIVADGAVFPDGTTVVRWRDLGGAAARGVQPTTVVFPSLESVLALHGHGGSTVAVWDDDWRAGQRPPEKTRPMEDV